MNSEYPHHHGLIADDDIDAISTADFYFDDPALHFPLSPISVRKEIFSLTPFCEEPQSLRKVKEETCWTLSNVKQPYHTNMDLPLTPIKHRTTLCTTLSPRSEGTQTTTDWMKDSCDTDSCCGSLTYSVETDRFVDDYDEQNIATVLNDSTIEVLDGPTQEENPQNCFRILDGVIFAIQILFGKQDQQLFDYTEHMQWNYGTINNPRAICAEQQDL
jgi:hypothetical protein